MDPFGFSCLLPVVFGGCEGSKVVVCEVRGFSAGDAFAYLKVAGTDDKRGLVTALGVGFWFGWCPFG